ncbi:MAG: hypothetical protein PSX71_14025 [bacterium]|nr:hypothetical protein [bacterium]
MNDMIIENEKVGGWWAASSDAAYEQVSLYEVLGSKESLLDSFTVTKEEYPSLEDFKLEVKRIFGGGIYVAAVRGPLGTFAKRPQFAISGRPIREKAEEAAPVQQQSGLEVILAQIAESNRRSDEKFAQLMAREPVKQPDTLELFDKVAGILQKTTAPVQEKAQSMLEKAMEKKFLQFMEDGLGGSSGDESLMPIFAELIGGIRETMAESEKTKRLEIAAGVRKAGGQEAPALLEPPAPAITEVNTGPMGLLSLLSQLVEAAEAKADVADIAQQIVAKVAGNQEAKESLKALLDSEDAIDKLEKFNPKVGVHFEWFAELANTVMDLMDGDADGGTDSEPADKGQQQEPASVPVVPHTGRRGGNAANTAADASPRAPRKNTATGKAAGAKPGQ